MNRFALTRLALMVLLATVFAVLPGEVLAGSVTITTATGSGADSFIHGDAALPNPPPPAFAPADSNYGADPVIQVKVGGGATYTRLGYVRFDLSSAPKPINSAALAMTSAGGTTVNTGAKIIQLYGVANSFTPATGQLDEAWPEGAGTILAPIQGSGTGGGGSLAWNNAPGRNTLLPGSTSLLASQATLLARARIEPAPAAGDRLYFSGQALIDFINADTDNKVTFVLVVEQDAGQDTGFRFAAKEFTPPGGAMGDWAPALTVSNVNMTTTTATLTADTQVQGTSLIPSITTPCSGVPTSNQPDNKDRNYGGNTYVTLKTSGTNDELGYARKVYLRFDVSDRVRPAEQATLTLKAGDDGQPYDNTYPGGFTLNLWGLNDADNLDGWSETGIVWGDGSPAAPYAPGNDPASSTQMDLTKATLLAQIPVPQNLGNSDLLQFTNANSVTPNALLNFINTRAVDTTVTLVVTVNESVGQVNGFQFKHRGDLNCPPRLLVDGGASEITASEDSTIRGGANALINYGSDALVRANGKGGDAARKAYFKFEVGATPFSDVTFKLTHGTSSTNNLGLIHTLLLYGLKESTAGQDWVEGADTGVNIYTGTTPPSPITWTNAPANDPTTADGKIADQATLLARIDLPRIYASGDVIAEITNYHSVTPNALIDFINGDTDGKVTFILAPSASHQPMTGQDLGWRIATKEHGTVAPPTLKLMGVPTCKNPVFDVNNDGQVNGLDLSDSTAGFMLCATGPSPAAGVFEGRSDFCKCLDSNDDSAIDMKDFAVFQRCLTVGGGAVNTACDD